MSSGAVENFSIEILYVCYDERLLLCSSGFHARLYIELYDFGILKWVYTITLIYILNNQ